MCGVSPDSTYLKPETLLKLRRHVFFLSDVSDLLTPAGYIRIRSIRVLGIVLCVFCRRKHLNHLREIETSVRPEKSTPLFYFTFYVSFSSMYV